MFKTSVRILVKRVNITRKNHVWTPNRVVMSPYKDINIPNSSVIEYMWSNLHKWENKIAVICSDTGRQYTYLQIYNKSQAFGVSLQKKFNVRSGDVVAVMLPNVPEYPTVAFGILVAGAVVTTFNHLYTPYEIKSNLQLSQPKIIVTLPEYTHIIKEGLHLAKLEIPIIALDVERSRPDNTVSFKELIDEKIDLNLLKQYRSKPDDVMGLLYSSGTTGLPKGVELTNRNIVSNCEQNSMECRQYECTTENYQDAILGIVPFAHSSGFSINMFHKLSAGTKLVFVKKFQPDTFANVLKEHKINHATVTPPTFQFLATCPEVSSEHLKHLRSIVVGAAPLPVPDIERFLDKVNHKIHFGQIYGLTETSPVVTLGPIGFDKVTSVGYALPNISLRVLDTENNNLGPNQEGELLIKGPNVMKGYKDNPKANGKAFFEGEWLRSGDLVKIDEEGAVYVVDRIKDLIKVKAFQVPPAELENIIKEIPMVTDVAVVGVEDPRTGQRPKAFVVINDKRVTEMEIMNYVNQRVAPFKHLKEVAFIKKIPKNTTGKILKKELIKTKC